MTQYVCIHSLGLYICQRFIFSLVVRIGAPWLLEQQQQHKKCVCVCVYVFRVGASTLPNAAAPGPPAAGGRSGAAADLSWLRRWDYWLQNELVPPSGHVHAYFCEESHSQVWKMVTVEVQGRLRVMRSDLVEPCTLQKTNQKLKKAWILSCHLISLKSVIACSSMSLSIQQWLSGCV